MDAPERASNEAPVSLTEKEGPVGDHDGSGADPGAIERAFLPPGSASQADLERLDLRIGRVVGVEPFPAARIPAYRLTIDFGPGGTKRSSARLPGTYPRPEELLGRLVVAVVNLPSKRIAGFSSEVLVLGGLAADGRIPLLSVDLGAQPGDPVG